MLTVKKLIEEVNKERYDKKNVPVYVAVQGQRFTIEDINIYDNEVHLTVGQPIEEDVTQ